MNARSSWLGELWRVVILLLIALGVGLIIDAIAPAIIVALVAYTVRNLYNLQKLSDWLGDPQLAEVPLHLGLLGDIYSKTARNASRQAQREERLSRLVDEYTASTSALPDGTVAFDADGRIVWFNEAASRLLGLVAAKDIGQPLRNLFRNPEISSFIRAADYSRSLETNAPGNATVRLEVRLAPYGAGQTLMLAQDVTSRATQERIRRDFVANVSHELRMPLTVISGFIENLQNDEQVSAERLKRPLELMAQQTSRMRQIVEDLLLLSSLESAAEMNETAAVDIGAMLRSIADECQGLHDDAARITVKVGTTRKVVGDEKQLHSAVTNLVVNALNHTPAGGVVTLSWENRIESAMLTVRDTGEGIASEHLPRLTERFYRVDSGRSRERGGTGLGLAIVKHIMIRHQATFEIESEVGVGSCFSGLFPASRLLA